MCGASGARLLGHLGFLGAPVLGDVAANAHQSGDAPVGVAQGHLGGGVKAPLPGAIDHFFFALELRLACLDDGPIVVRRAGLCVGGNHGQAEHCG